MTTLTKEKTNPTWNRFTSEGATTTYYLNDKVVQVIVDPIHGIGTYLNKFVSNKVKMDFNGQSGMETKIFNLFAFELDYQVCGTDRILYAHFGDVAGDTRFTFKQGDVISSSFDNMEYTLIFDLFTIVLSVVSDDRIPSNEEFEDAKAAMINNGVSIDVARDYIFDEFESVMQKVHGQFVSVHYHGFLHLTFVYENFGLTVTDDAYIFGSTVADDICSPFRIEKWQIADILIDIDELEQEITLLLVSGDEIILDLNNVELQ